MKKYYKKNKMIDINNVINLDIEGVNASDYPDFCDAYFSSGYWSGTGNKLTEKELDVLSNQYPEILSEMAYKSLTG